MTPAGTPAAKKDFTNLDFMRSVAVLLVASAHVLLYLGKTSSDGWSGITGVCIFFVHTTLVLMWSLDRDPNVGSFYLRRAFRIYPLWLVVLALTVATHLPMSPAFAPHFGYQHPTHRELISNALLLSNILWPATIVGASWTLPLEVQMYVFLPCLYFFARQMRRIWPLLFLNFFLIFFDINMFGPVNSGLPMVAPYFLPGVMTYVLTKRDRPKLPSWAFPIFLFVLVAIDHSYGSFRHSWLFCLILGLGIPFFDDMTAKPIRVASHYVAKYSYGVYLSHIMAIGVSFYVLRSHSTSLRIASFLALFIGLPVLFYHAVEEPMIRAGAKLARHFGRPPRITERTLELEMVP